MKEEELADFSPRRDRQIDEALKDLVGADYLEELGFPFETLASFRAFLGAPLLGLVHILPPL